MQFAAPSGGTWIGIVDERHAVADEDVVLDGHALTDERMARDFAVLADLRVLLDFHESPDLGVIAHFTAVEIDELRERNPFAQLHIGSDADILAHSAMARPLSFSD